MNRLRKSWFIIGSLLLTIGLVGCAGNDLGSGNDDLNGLTQVRNNEGSPFNGSMPGPLYGPLDGPMNIGVQQDIDVNKNNQRTLMISKLAEQQVKKLQEVNDARVIVSNNQAYVALKLTKSNRGRISDQSGKSLKQNQSVQVEEGRINRQNDGRMNARTRTENDDDYIVIDFNRANNKINNQQVSNTFEQRVANQVRKADRNIHKVYITDNAQFFTQMNIFANRLSKRNNHDSIFKDITNMLNNFFQ